MCFVPNNIKQSLGVQRGMVLTGLGDKNPLLCPDSESFGDLYKVMFLFIFLFCHILIKVSI